MALSKTVLLGVPLLVLSACADADYNRGPYSRYDNRYDAPAYGWGRDYDRYDRYGYDRHDHDRHDYDRRRVRDYGYRDDKTIRRGAQSGQLTQRELNDLRKDQRDIERERRQAAADGVITRREQEDIRDEIRDYQDNLNHNLRDGERR